MYSISALCSLPVALSDGFLYVTYTTAFSLGSPDTLMIRTSPPLI